MGLLSVQNASLRFGGIVALDEVSLEAEEGTIFGLIGPNGAGKTTAFNVITRLYRLDSGDIVFDGRSLLHTPPSRVVRLGIARTFQNVELFPTLTVLENVLVGAHTVSRTERSLWKRETVCAPTSTFSSTVIIGKSSTFWNVRAIPSRTTRLGGVCRRERPSKTMSPESSR